MGAVQLAAKEAGRGELGDSSLGFPDMTDTDTTVFIPPPAAAGQEGAERPCRPCPGPCRSAPPRMRSPVQAHLQLSQVLSKPPLGRGEAYRWVWASE